MKFIIRVLQNQAMEGAVYLERGTYGSMRGLRKPAVEKRQGGDSPTRHNQCLSNPYRPEPG